MAAADAVVQALAYLQVHSANDGTSMYDHLVKLVNKVLEDQPSKAVDLLEASLLVKKSTFDAKESSPLVPVPVVPDATQTAAAVSLFGDPELPINRQTGEPYPADPPNEFECENMSGASMVLDCLGVGLGREVGLNVALAAKRIGEDPKLAVKSVRFFGKFMGLYADYYVFEVAFKEGAKAAEGVAAAAPAAADTPAAEGQAPAAASGTGPAGSASAAPEEVPPEAPGTGANKFTYLVCSALGGPLTRLPNVTPAQVKASRRIKKLLTGRLTSHVSTYPAFPGNEANYLRALIARIGAATVVAPTDFYGLNDETEELEAAEDWEPPPGRELAVPSAWVHVRPHLKSQGRCEVFKRELPEDADEDEFYNEDELEEGPDLLASLEEDAQLPGEQAAWTPLYSSSSEAVKKQAGGLRSLVWPGAVCGGREGVWTCVYVGWGVKNAPFVPLPPPPVAAEFDWAAVETQELELKPVPPPEDEEEAED
ncbi:putative splicing factor, arginine/serine-rich 4 [Pleodorina starrii]|uniref:Splicing factor, arginine/serine-rich 4 n=1 Tax=Pleodorina starrii TaxID=330485 RepID=A0A9W6BZI4_9CHLO|nr:putative splicing factor [Pleodorina starrii]GLC61133.1 putative splicing factor, arginine/serine-rich 4 [Pleodorina starrii]GLC69539.1 putative splicing factor [Pleodorina starrii]